MHGSYLYSKLVYSFASPLLPSYGGSTVLLFLHMPAEVFAGLNICMKMKKKCNTESCLWRVSGLISCPPRSPELKTCSSNETCTVSRAEMNHHREGQARRRKRATYWNINILPELFKKARGLTSSVFYCVSGKSVLQLHADHLGANYR